MKPFASLRSVSGFRPYFMPNFKFQSDSFTPDMAPSSTLRVVAGGHHVSMSVQQGSRLLALKSWQTGAGARDYSATESDLRMIFGGEQLLEYHYANKSCALFSPAATLVPRRLFDPADLKPYFKLLTRDEGARSYGYEKIEAFDCYLVWAAEPGLFHLCQQYFPQTSIRHLAAPLLEAFRRLAPEEGYAVYANIHAPKVQIAVLERQNLVFFNVFEFNKPSDLLYFVLLAYKQFDLNPLEIPLTISGALAEDSEAFKLLNRYIKPLRFPPLPTGFQLPEQAKTLPAHFWFDLFASGA